MAGPPLPVSVVDQILTLGAGYDAPNGSSAVRMLQRHLALAGVASGAIDGRYGPLTERAVADFQASHGLQVDGIVGPETWTALVSSRLSVFPGAGNQPGGSQLVRTLQRRLELAGYASGPIDGRYGQLTEHAVRRFQAAHGLPVTGVAGPGVLSLTTTTAHRAPALRASQHGHAERAATPVETNVQRPSHRGSAPSVGLLLILVAAGLAAILVALWWYVRRRRGERLSPAPGTRVDANRPRTSELHGALVLPLDRDTAAAVSNGGDQRESATTEEIVGRVDQHDDVDASFNHGLILEDQGDVDGAIAAYEGADEQGHAASASNLGVLLEERGATAAAEAAYRRADERGDATGAFNHGVLLEERGGVAEAEAAYRRADERGHAAAASNLGVLLEQRGASAAAEAAYRRADERGDATGAFNLGILLEERGALSDAEQAYSRADDRGNDEVASVARGALLELRARALETSVELAVASHDHG